MKAGSGIRFATARVEVCFMFQDRRDAGIHLAQKLRAAGVGGQIILGLPRGGVPVAHEISKSLRIPLDILVVRKIGLPLNPELTIGAMGEDKVPLFNQNMIAQLNLKNHEIQDVVQSEKFEIQRQIRLFRQDRKAADFRNREVIVVDDGLATGGTAAAAVKYLRKHGAGRIILAIPVAAEDSAERLRKVADEVVVVEESPTFLAVSHWYGDFTPVSDRTVVNILLKSKKKSTLVCRIDFSELSREPN